MELTFREPETERSPVQSEFFEAVRDLTIAWWEGVTPATPEEEQQLKGIESTNGWVLVSTHDDAKTAYARAAALRGRELPSGTWEFTGNKVTDDEAVVLCRYVSREDPEPETDEQD